jgi:hypothetical protein
MRSSPAIIEPIVVESKVDHESIVERLERISQLFQIEIVDGVHWRATSEAGHLAVLSRAKIQRCPLLLQ